MSTRIYKKGSLAIQIPFKTITINNKNCINHLEVCVELQERKCLGLKVIGKVTVRVMLT